MKFLADLAPVKLEKNAQGTIVPTDFTPQDIFVENIMSAVVTLPFVLILNILIELPIYLIIFRKKNIRTILSVCFANFVSTSLFLFTIYTTGLISIKSILYARVYLDYLGIGTLIIFEAVVVLIEFLILKWLLKDIPAKKILLASICANITSFLLGTGLYALLQYRAYHPL